MPACYAGCYGGGYSGCYGGWYGGGCYGGCYGGGCYGGVLRRRATAGLLRRQASPRLRRLAVACSVASTRGERLARLRLWLHGPGVLRLSLRPACYASAYSPAVFGSALGMSYGPITSGQCYLSGQSMTAPSKQWGTMRPRRSGLDDDPVRSDDSGAADPGDASGDAPTTRRIQPRLLRRCRRRPDGPQAAGDLITSGRRGPSGAAGRRIVLNRAAPSPGAARVVSGAPRSRPVSVAPRTPPPRGPAVRSAFPWVGPSLILNPSTSPNHRRPRRNPRVFHDGADPTRPPVGTQQGGSARDGCLLAFRPRPRPGRSTPTGPRMPSPGLNPPIGGFASDAERLEWLIETLGEAFCRKLGIFRVPADLVRLRRHPGLQREGEHQRDPPPGAGRPHPQGDHRRRRLLDRRHPRDPPRDAAGATPT